ncbi:MFS transporter asaE [Vanrija pseudolonga]|uniref:MFS transporter asaE n=1 Tax=Vanrija pseudolonga TaxID=143232 RepID=A0AAF0YAN8_9TREE|nr:MFS transporter asaE [Vanrija pseudolonga]
MAPSATASAIQLVPLTTDRAVVATHSAAAGAGSDHDEGAVHSASLAEREPSTPGDIETGTPSSASSPALPLAGVDALPLVDGGPRAWAFLAAATTIEFMVWGLPFSVGVLNAYWSESLFPGQPQTVALASTLPQGLLLFSGAVLAPLFTLLPWHEKRIQAVGMVIATVGLIASAFATKAWHLVVTFGCLYPFATALYFPCPIIVFEWFQARRGLASGVVFAGTGAGGAAFPYIVTSLLGRFGYRTTMLALGVAFISINSVALTLIKRRVPLAARVSSSTRRPRPRTDFSFLAGRAAWAAFAFITISNLGSFIPLLWMPSYATATHATRPDGTTLVAIMNGITAPGFLLNGHLSDRLPARIVICTSCLLATLSCLLLWGYGTSAGPLVAFAIVWGITAGSTSGIWSKMVTVINKSGDPSVPAWTIATFACLKGVGSLTSGPISNALLATGPLKGAGGAFGSTNYGSLFIYTAVTTFAGGLVAIAFPDK